MGPVERYFTITYKHRLNLLKQDLERVCLNPNIDENFIKEFIRIVKVWSDNCRLHFINLKDAGDWNIKWLDKIAPESVYLELGPGTSKGEIFYKIYIEKKGKKEYDSRTI